MREIERTESLLQRQLSKWAERTETLRAQSQEKAARAKEKMEELRAVHKRLTEERGDKGKDIERRRVRIEQTEKKVCFILGGGGGVDDFANVWRRCWILRRISRMRCMRLMMSISSWRAISSCILPRWSRLFEVSLARLVGSGWLLGWAWS